MLVNKNNRIKINNVFWYVQKRVFTLLLFITDFLEW